MTALCVALRLWLAVIIEVVEKKRCLWFNILREKLLHLLIFAKRNLERAGSDGKVSSRSRRCQWNIMLVFWAVLYRRRLNTGLLMVLPLVLTLTVLWLLFEIVETLGLGLLQIVWRHGDLLHIFDFFSIFLNTLRWVKALLKKVFILFNRLLLVGGELFAVFWILTLLSVCLWLLDVLIWSWVLLLPIVFLWRLITLVILEREELFWSSCLVLPRHGGYPLDWRLVTVFLNCWIQPVPFYFLLRLCGSCLLGTGKKSSFLLMITGFSHIFALFIFFVSGLRWTAWIGFFLVKNGVFIVRRSG